MSCCPCVFKKIDSEMSSSLGMGMVDFDSSRYKGLSDKNAQGWRPIWGSVFTRRMWIFQMHSQVFQPMFKPVGEPDYLICIAATSAKFHACVANCTLVQLQCYLQ